MIFTRILSISLFSLFSISVYGQTFNCPDIINNQTMEEAFITFSGVVCDDMNNMDPNDDVITFTVSGENGNSSQSITGFPVWPPTIQMNSNLNLDNMSQELNIWAGNNPFNEQVMAVSPGCAPLNLTLTWGLSATNCNPEMVILDPAGAAIPTMSQWGIIILGFIVLIVGIVFIRQERLSLT